MVVAPIVKGFDAVLDVSCKKTQGKSRLAKVKERTNPKLDGEDAIERR
jgi:hypothetical protein